MDGPGFRRQFMAAVRSRCRNWTKSSWHAVAGRAHQLVREKFSRCKSRAEGAHLFDCAGYLSVVPEWKTGRRRYPCARVDGLSKADSLSSLRRHLSRATGHKRGARVVSRRMVRGWTRLAAKSIQLRA